MQMTATPDTRAEDMAAPAFSVVLAASRHVNVAEALRQYRAPLDALGKPYEVLCVIEGTAKAMLEELDALKKDWPELETFARRPWGGEDAELATAYGRAKGDLILTLPPFLEILPEEISKLFEKIDDSDMVVVNRDAQPISGSRQNLMKRVFKLFFGHTVSDVFSRTRLSRRDVLEEVGRFGVRQHFIPVIAANRGYRVVEVPIAKPTIEQPASSFAFRPVGHVSALFDAITLFVVLKFLRRPLRFFGAIGLPIFLVGIILTLGFVFGRLFFDLPLADRPALIFSVLMVVFGVQIIAIGLVGEIVIFANSRHMKQYKVASIIKRDPGASLVQEIPHKDE